MAELVAGSGESLNATLVRLRRQFPDKYIEVLRKQTLSPEGTVNSYVQISLYDAPMH